MTLNRQLAPAMVLAAAGWAAAPQPAQAARLCDASGPYQVQVLLDGVQAPTYSHNRNTWVLGERGQRYQIRVTNGSNRRIEVVVSVDGRDVIDGATADYREKRGYLVPAYDSVTIDGWRLSQGQAAAFRFASVADSYAARTGSARDVGVIGVAVFPEREVPRPGPRLSRTREEYDGGSAGANSARADSSSPSAAGAESSKQSDGRAAAGERASAPPSRRPGLGTEFGEAVNSPIEEVAFTRASAGRPAALLGLRYDDARGLSAQGIDLEPATPDEAWLRRSAEPFPGERAYAKPPSGWSRSTR